MVARIFLCSMIVILGTTVYPHELLRDYSVSEPTWLSTTLVERLVIMCREIRYDIGLIMETEHPEIVLHERYEYLAQKIFNLYNALEALSANNHEARAMLSEDICYLQAALSRLEQTLTEIGSTVNSALSMRLLLLVTLLKDSQLHIRSLYNSNLEYVPGQPNHC